MLRRAVNCDDSDTRQSSKYANPVVGRTHVLDEPVKGPLMRTKFLSLGYAVLLTGCTGLPAQQVPVPTVAGAVIGAAVSSHRLAAEGAIVSTVTIVARI